MFLQHVQAGADYKTRDTIIWVTISTEFVINPDSSFETRLILTHINIYLLCKNIYALCMFSCPQVCMQSYTQYFSMTLVSFVDSFKRISNFQLVYFGNYRSNWHEFDLLDGNNRYHNRIYLRVMEEHHSMYREKLIAIYILKICSRRLSEGRQEDYCR